MSSGSIVDSWTSLTRYMYTEVQCIYNSEEGLAVLTYQLSTLVLQKLQFALLLATLVSMPFLMLVKQPYVSWCALYRVYISPYFCL